MNLPFTSEEFTRVFIAYNQAIWPIQVATWALGVVALSAILSKKTWSGRAVFAILALLWV